MTGGRELGVTVGEVIGIAELFGVVMRLKIGGRVDDEDGVKSGEEMLGGLASFLTLVSSTVLDCG
jgi:hypothetical protein